MELSRQRSSTELADPTGLRSQPWDSVLSVFQHMTDGILILDELKKITGMNRAAEEILGWKEEELRHKEFFCQICEGLLSQEQEGPRLSCHQCNLLTENAPYLEMTLKRKDGSSVSITATSTQLPPIDQSPARTIVTIRDISEHKQELNKKWTHLLSQKMMRTLEEERKRVSKDLHDGIGQSIFGIQMGLTRLKERLDDKELAHACDNLLQMTAQTLEEVRNISAELRPSILDDLGLVPAIRSYIKRVQPTVHLRIQFTYNCNIRFNPDAETALYRIFQEALTNAIKYSEADSFTVDLSVSVNEEDRCRIDFVLQDNGKGFLPNEIGGNGRGLGLFGMRERVAQLGGLIRIDSAPGEGTAIQVKLQGGGKAHEYARTHPRGR